MAKRRKVDHTLPPAPESAKRISMWVHEIAKKIPVITALEKKLGML